MRIVLQYRDPGPSTLFIAAETITFLSAFGLAVYLFITSLWVYGLIAIAAGLLVMFLFKESWPAPLPVVLINDEGIFDRRMAFGLIRWSDILDAQIEVKGPFLCLRLKNPEEYIAKLPTQQKLKFQFNQSLGFNMLYLDMKNLGVNLLDLLEQVRKRIAQNQL